MSTTKVSAALMESGTKGADISSASSITIGLDGSYMDITGTTTIATMVCDAGRIFTLQFDGAVTLTHSSTLYLAGAVDFVTEANDHLTFVAVAANDVRQIGAGLKDGGSPVAAATSFDDNKLQTNIALLGFKIAVNGSLAKYNLVDQIVDEYTDATGVDASASTNERLSAGAYDGEATVTPTVTEDADSTAVDGDYTYYKWTDTGSTGSYNTDTTQDHEWLILAGGGGGGGGNHGGGAGGGGYRIGTTLSLTGGNAYTVTVGAGGAGGSGSGGNNPGSVGGNSILSGTGITTITSTGGGGGGSASHGVDGGSGGGAGAHSGGLTKNGGSGNTPSITQYTAAGETTTIQGYDGGSNGGHASSQYPAGGGGGAGAVGQAAQSTSVAGAGGAGVNNDITGASVAYAGGGGGGIYSGGTAGTASFGGGAGTANGIGANGTANTGGGAGGGNGGAGFAGGTGGSGVVILRRLTSTTGDGGNLTLQSNDTTASTANPDYADMIILMENAEGTATLNTDIKGYISEDSGVTFTQGTLVEEGTWGTDKKIIAFHDLDISAQTGSAMCYKITTHNQSAGSKETKIHATSIGWR